MAVRAIYVSVRLEQAPTQRRVARALALLDGSCCVVLTNSGVVDFQHSIWTSLLLPSRAAVRKLRLALPSAQIHTQVLHVVLREEVAASRWFVLTWGNSVPLILSSMRMRPISGSHPCEVCGSGRLPGGPVKIDWNQQSVARAKVLFGREECCLIRTKIAHDLVASGLACRGDFLPVMRDPTSRTRGPADGAFSLVRPQMRVPRASDTGAMIRQPTRATGWRRMHLSCQRCGRDGWVRGVGPTIVEGVDWPDPTGCGLAGTWEELSMSRRYGKTAGIPSWPLVLASPPTAAWLRSVVGTDAVLSPVIRPDAVGRHRWPRDPRGTLYVDHLREGR